MTITNPAHDLTLGSLSFVQGIPDGDYWFEVGADGATHGNPTAVRVEMPWQGKDGTLAYVDSYGNREPGWPIWICAPDAQALAEGEAALFAECSKTRNELTWTPPDGFGPPTVFDVLIAHPEHEFDDFDELRLKRKYTIRFECLPFGRSPWSVTTDAVTSAASPSTVTINDGSSTSGWSSSDGTAPTTDGSTISLAMAYAASSLSTYSWETTERWLRLAGSFDFSSTQYLVVDYVSTVTVTGALPGVRSITPAPRVKADGGELTRLSQQASPTTGFMRATYLAPASTVALLEFYGYGQTDRATAAPTGTFRVTNLSRTNQAATLTTLRQKPLTLPIIGSARAIGSLSVSHASSGLGDVIVHTCADVGDGYTPAMSPWMSSGTTDATTVSGKRWANTLSATVPLRILRPGPYEVLIHARKTSGSLTPTMTVTLGASTLTASSQVTFSGLNVWQVLNLGVLNVGDHLPETTATTALSLSTSISSADIAEVWLFYAGDDASRTQIAAGSYKRVWLDTPSLTNPKRSVWVGSLADRSDAVSGFSLLSSWGRHDLDPDGVCQFVVTTDALDASTQATYCPTFHTHNAYQPVT